MVSGQMLLLAVAKSKKGRYPINISSAVWLRSRFSSDHSQPIYDPEKMEGPVIRLFVVFISALILEG